VKKIKIKVKAKATKEIFKNNTFRIIAWSPLHMYNELKLSKYFTFTTKGETPFVTIGKEYEIEIEELATDNYGTSYKIISVPSMEEQDLHNLTIEQSKEILMDCTSSKRIADNIISAYPNFIELIMTKGKEFIDLKKIKGVGEAYLNAYTRELLDKYKYYSTIKKLKDYEINITDCKLLFQTYHKEEDIINEISKKPYYVLIEVLKRQFEYVDKQILELKPELKVSEQRCEALIISVLRRNEIDGSTRLNGNDLYYYINKEYDAKELIPMLKDVSKNSDYIYYDEKSNDLSVLTTYLGECKVADFVKDKIENSHKLDIDWTKYKKTGEFEMSDMQMNCLKNLCESDISLLAGYSGTGKSQSVKGLVSLMEDNHLTYTLLSSTGKASKVLSESTSRPSSTIHKKCYQGEITTDVIIVDEVGMVALDTFCMLISQITNPKAKIVLVGDPAQLSAIGLSKIFDDLIKSNKIPTTMLTEVFRYKSDGSLFVATNVRNGKTFFEDKDMVKQKDNEYLINNNYKFISTNVNDILNITVDEYKKLLSKGIKQKDIMCLSPFNIGSIGTYMINNSIQAEINPPKPNEIIQKRKVGKTNIIFRVNDIVINTKNDYNAVPEEEYQKIKKSNNVLTEDDIKSTVIVNGQTGTIREVIDNGLIVQFDEEMIYVSKNKLNHLLLGYAISTHKSQGSTVDYTISIVSNIHSKMLTRGLIYVATTRCRKSHIDIGSTEAFENALKVNDNDLRKTWLLELL